MRNTNVINTIGSNTGNSKLETNTRHTNKYINGYDICGKLEKSTCTIPMKFPD